MEAMAFAFGRLLFFTSFPSHRPPPFRPPTPFSVACSRSKKELDEYGIPKEYDPDFGLSKEVWDEARNGKHASNKRRRSLKGDVKKRKKKKIGKYLSTVRLACC